MTALRPLLALAAAAAAAGCVTGRSAIDLPDRPPLPPGAALLSFAGGGATNFFRPDSRPCGRPGT